MPFAGYYPFSAMHINEKAPQIALRGFLTLNLIG
jgi:hypothetical protein